MDVHKAHCDNVAEELGWRAQLYEAELAALPVNTQSSLGGRPHSQQLWEKTFGDVALIADWNCRKVDAPYLMVSEGKVDIDDELSTDPSAALLQFMIAATPNSHLAEEMQESPESFLSKMSVTPVASLVGDGRITHQSTIDNVPDTVNPVKSRMAWVQVPHESGTTLELVWKVSDLAF